MHIALLSIFTSLDGTSYCSAVVGLCSETDKPQSIVVESNIILLRYYYYYHHLLLLYWF
jgi:hypothetical protein